MSQKRQTPIERSCSLDIALIKVELFCVKLRDKDIHFYGMFYLDQVTDKTMGTSAVT